MMLLLRELKGLRFRDIVASISRPLIAVSIMALCVIFCRACTRPRRLVAPNYQDTCWCGNLLSEHPRTVVGFGTTFRCRVVSIGKSDALAKALRPYGPGGPVESNLEYA